MSHFHIRKTKNGLWNSVNTALKPFFASKIIKNCEKLQKTSFVPQHKRRFHCVRDRLNDKNQGKCTKMIHFPPFLTIFWDERKSKKYTIFNRRNIISPFFYLLFTNTPIYDKIGSAKQSE